MRMREMASEAGQICPCAFYSAIHGKSTSLGSRGSVLGAQQVVSPASGQECLSGKGLGSCYPEENGPFQSAASFNLPFAH